jgi:hypothetical protein
MEIRGGGGGGGRGGGGGGGGGGEGAYLLSLICVIKPSIVVTSPPRVPLPNSKSSSGTFTLAVSD